MAQPPDSFPRVPAKMPCPSLTKVVPFPLTDTLAPYQDRKTAVAEIADGNG